MKSIYYALILSVSWYILFFLTGGGFLSGSIGIGCGGCHVDNTYLVMKISLIAAIVVFFMGWLIGWGINKPPYVHARKRSLTLLYFILCICPLFHPHALVSIFRTYIHPIFQHDYHRIDRIRISENDPVFASLDYRKNTVTLFVYDIEKRTIPIYHTYYFSPKAGLKNIVMYDAKTGSLYVLAIGNMKDKKQRDYNGMDACPLFGECVYRVVYEMNTFTDSKPRIVYKEDGTQFVNKKPELGSPVDIPGLGKIPSTRKVETNPIISPDGKKKAIIIGEIKEPRVQIQSLDNPEENVVSRPALGFFSILWSHDSTKVYFNNMKDSAMQSLAFPSGQEELFPDSNNIGGVSFISPDNRYVASFTALPVSNVVLYDVVSHLKTRILPSHPNEPIVGGIMNWN